MPMSDWTQLTTDGSSASGVYLWFVNIAKQVATTTPAIYGRAVWISDHLQPCGRAGCLHDQHYGRVRTGILFTTRNLDVQGVIVMYRIAKECICRNQSGTGIRGPSPVPDWDVGRRNAVDSLDADALLYIKTSNYFALIRLCASKILSRKIRKPVNFAEGKEICISDEKKKFWTNLLFLCLLYFTQFEKTLRVSYAKAF
jgi:hypothetical protein